MSDAFTIPGPAGQIEAILDKPEDARTDYVAVICHPHPLHGGTMSNKVVTTLARAFRELNMVSLRFNFRGIGQSEGEFADAIGETDDCLAAVDWVSTQFPGAKLILAGFSFGSYCAYRAQSQRDTAITISVAPPVHHYDFTTLPSPVGDWIVLMGDDDDVVPSDQVYDWLSTLAEAPTLIRFEAAGHFFHGKLVAFRQRLIEALTECLS